MMHSMKSGLIRWTLLAVAFVLIQPAAVMAQAASYDARLEGYSGNVTLGTSPLITWLVFVAIVGACVGVMFVKVPRPKEED
jgi:hypothetical protein